MYMLVPVLLCFMSIIITTALKGRAHSYQTQKSKGLSSFVPISSAVFPGLSLTLGYSQRPNATSKDAAGV